MDILRPQIIRIGDRCYRKNPIKSRDINTAEEDDFNDYMPEPAVDNDETCTLDCVNVEQTEDGGYRIKVAAPSQLFKFVIGRKGETKNRLENETRTKIKIPRQGQEGDIVIQGHDRGGVVSAKTRIEVLLDSGRQKQPFTHFLSIPVNVKHIQDKMLDFKDDVLRECDGDRGVDGTIFQDPAKTHLTLGCLVLLDDREVARAAEVLKDCKEDLVRSILKGQRLGVTFYGLEYMNDDPSEVDILYMKVEDPTDRLQTLADRLVDKFTSTGLMQREFDRVKLHATVMNTLFRKDPTDATEPTRRNDRGRKDRESFNAKRILSMFGDYDFGKHEITAVHLSQRRSFGRDGYYTCAGILDLS